MHHLGDDNYGGSVNSQFQKSTEGTSFTKSFEISSVQYNNYEKASLRFEAKGIQNFDNKLSINSVTYILPSSPSDGSYDTYLIELEKSAYQSGSNNLIITSGFGGDYDDFEFANIVIEFTGIIQDSDNDGHINSEDAFPDDPTEWLDTDNDNIGNNADLDDDNDGMPDTWELNNDLNPLDANDGSQDEDNDNLMNFEEYLANTNPHSEDTDGDGMNDYEEISQGFDPNDPSDVANDNKALMPIIQFLLD